MLNARVTLLVSMPALALVVAFAGQPAGAQTEIGTETGTETAVDAPIAGSAPVESRDPTLVASALTTEASDQYLLESDADTIRATAPQTNRGQNTRVVFARINEREGVDEQACITWSSQSHQIDQQGVALRIHEVASGGTSAITVTKNIWMGANWIFNVHVWNPNTTPEYTAIAQFDLSAAFRSGNAAAALPWRICARAVGPEVSFSVWPLARPRPAWTDAAYGGSVSLPPGYEEPGVAGSYIGHLRPGDSASFTALETTVFADSRLWAPGAPSTRQPTMIEALS